MKTRNLSLLVAGTLLFSMQLPVGAQEIDWDNEAMLLESLRQKSDSDLIQLDEEAYQNLMSAVDTHAFVGTAFGTVVAMAGTAAIVHSFMSSTIQPRAFRWGLRAGGAIATTLGILIVVTSLSRQQEGKSYTLVNLRDVVSQEAAEQVDALHEKLMMLNHALNTRNIFLTLTEEQTRQFKDEPQLHLTLPGEDTALRISNPNGEIIIPLGTAEKFRQTLMNKVFEALMSLQVPQIIAADRVRPNSPTTEDFMTTLNHTNITFPEITIERPVHNPEADPKRTQLNYTMNMGGIFHQAYTMTKHSDSPPTFLLHNGPYVPSSGTWSCFVAGTQVVTVNTQEDQTIIGHTPIEQIRAGDQVLSMHARQETQWASTPLQSLTSILEETQGQLPACREAAVGQFCVGQVAQTFVVENQSNLRDLFLGGLSLPLTGTYMHRFYTGGGWTRMKDLTAEKSLLVTQEPPAIQEVRTQEGTATVYNFHVEDTQTYFVAPPGSPQNFGIMVHNAK